MIKFLMQRILKVVITLFVVLVFVFVGARLTGDPFTLMYGEGLTQEEHARLMQLEGLDKPIPVQFKIYLQNAIKGDFGKSIIERQPVTEIIMKASKNSFTLRIWSFFVSIIFGTTIGIVASLRPHSRLSRFLMASTVLGYAVPGFVVAILMIFVFCYKLKLLPSMGMGTTKNLILPVVTLSAHSIATTARYVRTNFIDVLTQDYIRTAWAKGVGKRDVILKHAFKNILIPLVTVIGMLAINVVTGSLFIESVFAWPGMGRRMIMAVMNKDFPVIQFGVIYISLLVVAINFTVDILYGVIDPRIREGRS